MRLGCPIPGPFLGKLRKLPRVTLSPHLRAPIWTFPTFAEACVATRRKFPDTCLLKTAQDGRVPSKAQETSTNLRWDPKPNSKGQLSCGGGGGAENETKVNQQDTKEYLNQRGT